MMNTKDAAAELYDNTIRIERVVWLGGCHDRFSDSDAFDDLAMDMEAGGRYVHPTMKIFFDAPASVWDEEEEFLDWCRENQLTGFLVEVETPFPTFIGVTPESTITDTGRSYSWGQTNCIVMYVDNVLDAVPLAIEWKTTRYEAILQKAIEQAAAA
jgi:hypothetical protein